MLAVPNVSEGRDQAALDAIAHAFGPGLIHRSSDPDHHRAVFTIAGEPERCTRRCSTARARRSHASTSRTHAGIHPRVGAVDVAPIVYLDRRGTRRRLRRGARARRRARPARHPRLPLRRARGRTDARRAAQPAASRTYTPDFGPPTHPTAGATLVAARPPLVAFNVEIDAPLDTAKQIANDPAQHARRPRPRPAAADTVQVSTNIEDHRQSPPARGGRGGPTARARHRRRARRARPARRARGLPRRRPAPGPETAGRSSTLVGAMAQTKRKRRTKHRGNAAGSIEARGRTGRKPTAEEHEGGRPH